jgi:hypothetical protein
MYDSCSCAGSRSKLECGPFATVSVIDFTVCLKSQFAMGQKVSLMNPWTIQHMATGWLHTIVYRFRVIILGVRRQSHAPNGPGRLVDILDRLVLKKIYYSKFTLIFNCYIPFQIDVVEDIPKWISTSRRIQVRTGTCGLGRKLNGRKHIGSQIKPLECIWRKHDGCQLKKLQHTGRKHVEHQLKGLECTGHEYIGRKQGIVKIRVSPFGHTNQVIFV